MSNKKQTIEENADRIYMLMRKKGVSGKELAEKFGKSPQYISSMVKVDKLHEGQVKLIEFLNGLDDK